VKLSTLRGFLRNNSANTIGSKGIRVKNQKGNIEVPPQPFSTAEQAKSVLKRGKKNRRKTEYDENRQNLPLRGTPSSRQKESFTSIREATTGALQIKKVAKRPGGLVSALRERQDAMKLETGKKPRLEEFGGRRPGARQKNLRAREDRRPTA